MKKLFIIITLLIIASFSATTYGPNLVIDGGFETIASGTPDDGSNDNFTYWTEASTVVEQSLLEKNSGSASAKLTTNTTAIISTANFITVETGASYRLRAYAKTSGGDYVRVRVFGNHASDIVAYYYSGYTSTSWGLAVDTTFTVPEGCTGVLVYFRLGLAGQTIYIDDVTLEKETIVADDTGDKGYKETPKYKKFPDWR